jgi:hypothetical protein
VNGDFSRWKFDHRDNFAGVLPQQGRVLTDADGTEQTRIITHWEDTEARDVIGADVAAVPADEPDSFKIDEAKVSAGKVVVTVEPGHIWADGILAYLGATAPVQRVATYLQPPIQNPPFNETTIGANVRDAVILEVWRESISAFQVPEKLLEPALGGPDTAERVLTAYDFRLFRMSAGDNCDTIISKIKDDFSQKGKLTVSLQPPIVVAGDCPVVEGGGYTGFEHNLYRIEIAQVTSATPMFKWSRFDGGLVGMGVFDAATKTVAITANLQAITTSGLDQFYLEAQQFDADLGRWRVVYGAKATLNNSQLNLANTPTFGVIPGGPDAVFFRLWDDIRNIGDFPVQPSPAELRDGIRLEFEASAVGKYTPLDYWTFPVRAGGIKNPQTLINAQPPEGIHYHRVPLAELDWNAIQDVTAAAGLIEDCRTVFQPLTRISTCCTHRVGDGITSHGDFKSIQKAINSLPASGGEICVLPGVYTENVLIANRTNIRIHGCGPRSLVISGPPKDNAPADPVFTIKDSTHIELDSLAIQADPTGIGVLIDGVRSKGLAIGVSKSPPSGISSTRHILLSDLDIRAATRSAIEAHDGQFITIQYCRVEMQDVRTTFPGIFFLGEDSLIERNEIRVRSGRQIGPFEDLVVPASAATGGLQLAGGCIRVRVINNLIQGGIANGITLGSVVQIDANGGRGGIIGWVVDAEDPCNPCKPGSGVVTSGGGGDGGTRFISAGTLYDIRIERNRIQFMGLNGIGVIGFFDPAASKEIISVEGLEIFGNRIQRCLLRAIAEIPTTMLDAAGYGGISLADVTNLIVWDNRIEDNGPSHLEPICGIFILHGEGIEITRNIIRNNGAKNNESSERAKAGRRGGINIVFAIAPLDLVTFANSRFAHPDGSPALKVHENIVSAPLGRALTVAAMGPVSVIANHLTSLGIAPERAGIAVSTVLILNLGLPIELVGQLLTFQAISEGDLGKSSFGPAPSADVTVVASGAAKPATGRFLPDGCVLFTNNHCLLDLIEAAGNRFIVSIAIFTLDDLEFQNNQCMANLLQGFLLAQAFLFGLSNRSTDNRFEEPLRSAIYSAISLGLANITSQNEATHCLLIAGAPALLVKDPNTILIDALLPGFCKSPGRFFQNFASKRG